MYENFNIEVTPIDGPNFTDADREFITAVREVLTERGPDFIYDRNVRPASGPSIPGSCYYSIDGGKTGSCLFGAALIEKLGVPYKPGFEGAGIDAILRGKAFAGLGNDERIPSPLEGVSLAVQDAARVAQMTQDASSPYSKVARKFEDRLWGATQ